MSLISIYSILLHLCLGCYWVNANERNEYSQCGTRRNLTERVVKGVDAKPHSYPWAVMIRNNKMMHCGGTLISELFVLTAAHCINPDTVSVEMLTVVLGAHSREGFEDKPDVIEAAIEWLKIHENYLIVKDNDVNDIGLIKLRYPVVFTMTIRQVCLPQPGARYDGKKVTVCGWGRIQEDGALARFLQEATLVVIPYSDCKQKRWSDGLTPSMVCAGAEDPSIISDSCQGDSGGPLMYERTDKRVELVGVVSWGIGCANPEMPGVYTRVASYIDWIEKNMDIYTRKRKSYRKIKSYRNNTMKNLDEDSEIEMVTLDNDYTTIQPTE